PTRGRGWADDHCDLHLGQYDRLADPADRPKDWHRSGGCLGAADHHPGGRHWSGDLSADRQGAVWVVDSSYSQELRGRPLRGGLESLQPSKNVSFWLIMAAPPP